MKIEVKNWENEVVGSIDLPDEVFAREVNQHLVWEVVRAYLASRRRGTAKTKERSEVAGTRAKPWKQKHTGRARSGTKQSPSVAIGWYRVRSAPAILRAEGQQEGPQGGPQRGAFAASGGRPVAGICARSSSRRRKPRTFSSGSTGSV